MDKNRLDKMDRIVTGKHRLMLSEMTVDTVRDRIAPDSTIDSFFYYRITEIQKRWIEDEMPLWELMSSLFVGLSAVEIPVSVVFSCDGRMLRVFVGTMPDYTDVLEGMLRGVFPHLRLQENAMDNPSLLGFGQAVSQDCRVSGGFLKGNPAGSKHANAARQIDGVIQGMQGRPWHYSLFAIPVKRKDTISRRQSWMTEASCCGIFSELSVSESDGRETLNSQLFYPHGEQYFEKITQYIERLTESTALGEWSVTANFGSDSELHARLLGGLLVSAFFGESEEPSEPEPIHAIYYPSGQPTEVITSFDKMYYDPLTSEAFPEFAASCPRYSAFLSSREFGVLAAFPSVDTAGFAVVDPVQFDVAREATGDLSLGRVLDGNRVTDNEYKLDLNELNRHGLVVGLTGSGKTNTLKDLICAVTRDASRHFLVIEPAKKEYWELYNLGCRDLQIYSVGSSEPGSHRFCLNPFERVSVTGTDGIRRRVPLQTHIDFVFSAFKASFIMYTPMPYVLEQAIYRIYEECGWDVLNDVNLRGEEETYPTMEDLYDMIPVIVDEMGYDSHESRMRTDLIASLQARINTMRIGTKGATLNVLHSFPLAELLEQNVIIELEDVGDDDVKAFMISLLLIALLEIRRQQPDAQLEVRHLLLIEEAHRLLRNVQSGTGENADPRGAAVEFFCNLLAEMRSKGQGFIVADQIPSKLAPDLVKNTNLKITHRTVETEERELIGGAMHMTAEQMEALASLRQGVAAVYSEGDNRPKLIKAPFAGVYRSGRELNRAEVLRAVAPNCISVESDPGFRIQTNRQTAVCRKCSAHCARKPEDILPELADPEAFWKLAKAMKPENQPNKKTNIPALRREILSLLQREAALPAAGAELCVLQCLFEEWNSGEVFRKKATQRYLKLMKGE